MRQRPTSTEHAPYYANYIALVKQDDVMGALREQLDQATVLLRSIAEPDATILHAPYTWTIKQVIGHINDGERIFAYRALRIARGDATPLPGFDENAYARAVEFSRLRLEALADEFDSIRRATIGLFEHLEAESWGRIGEANGFAVSVRAIAFIIAGHAEHHLNIVRRRLGRA